MTEIVAIVACIVLAGLAIFQLLLVLGQPLGHFAWGGAHKILPTNLRVASVFSIFLYALFAFVILSKASLLNVADAGFIEIAAWVFTGYFFLGIVMNAISRSKPERLLMTPVAAILALSFLYVSLN